MATITPMHLNCHTYYSMRYGTLSPERLVSEAQAKGVEVLALTDINNTSACFDFYLACKKANIKPLLGIEFRNGQELLYVGIAKNNQGIRELNEHLTACSLAKTPLPTTAPDFEHAYVIYPFGSKSVADLKENEFIGVKVTDVPRLYGSEEKAYQDRLVIFHSVTFNTRLEYHVHRLLRAVDNNILFSQLTTSDHASSNEILMSMDRLLDCYRNFPQVIRSTDKLVANCSVDLDLDSPKNRKTFTGSRRDDRSLLDKLAIEGMRCRYGEHNREANARLEKELNIIDRLDFSAYFLITWDIVRYAQGRGYHHVGRGSGANSIVAYCLGITDIDPIELDLYFERFINPHRTSPPDFDIDFSWNERDEIIDYIFKRYGRKYVALLATYNTFKGKSIVRELGKVYGLPKSEIDAFLNSSYSEKGNHITDSIIRYGKLIEKFPNYLSIHAGGVLITEEPITCYTALEMMPKGFPTTHWDMHVAEDFGFYKYDILSQRGLGHIKDAVEYIRENRGTKVDIHQVSRFTRDEKVKKMLRKGKTMGCFYIESPAMRGLLSKLRCDTYLGLVAASSIIRPGVAKSGMMREYIWRFHHPDQFEYLHPIFKENLQETFGVMVYQEDVIKIAHHFAGLDLGEADILRRAMSGKTRSLDAFQKVIDKFFANCNEKGYPESLTKEVWRQMESFSGYSFCKAHSAGFAVESYQSLFLKAYYPLEFMTAVINNFGGFYRTEIYIHEARKEGANVEAPCVNHSNLLTRIRGETLYLGFIHLKDLEQKIGRAIPYEREKQGPFKNPDDFLNRVSISLEQLVILIRIGAFRFSGQSKKELLWHAHLRLGVGRSKPERSLFAVATKQYQLPHLVHEPLEDTYDEIELLGFPLCSPFDLLKTSHRGDIKAQELMNQVGKTVRMVGYLVSIKYIRTVKGDQMHFANFLDVDGDFFDTTHFPQSLQQYPFRGYGLYAVKGKIVEEFGHPSIEVDKMVKLPLRPDPRLEEELKPGRLRGVDV